MRDALVSELVELSPPGLTLLNFSGSSNLTKVVISPLTCCTKLADLDLSACASLDYVLIQSNSLLALNLRGCRNLSKALIHCPNLQTLQMTDCTEVQTIMLWSGVLKELDLTGTLAGYRPLAARCTAASPLPAALPLHEAQLTPRHVSLPIISPYWGACTPRPATV